MPAPDTPTKRMGEIATMFGRDAYSAAHHFETVERRIAELEDALRPFGEAYRYMQQMGPFVRREMEAATTVTEKFTVADLHRASELTKSLTLS